VEVSAGSGSEAVDVSRLLTIDDKGARPGVWTTDVEAAMKLAREKRLAVLELFIGSDWSYASGCFVKNVLVTEAWQKFVSEKFVLVFLDFPRRDQRMTEEMRRRNEQIRVNSRISDYPSMLFLDAEGKMLSNLRVNAMITTDELVRGVRLAYRELPWEQEALIRRTGNAQLLETYRKVNELYAARTKLLEENRRKYLEIEKAIGENVTSLSKGVLDWEISQKSPEDQRLYKATLEKLQTAEQELAKLRSGNIQMTVKTSERIDALQKEMADCQRVLEDILLR